MRLGLRIGLNSRQGGGGALDPDVRLYITAVVTAGATVTPTQRTAINNFVKTEKAASRWTMHKRLYLPIWGAAAPNAIEMITGLTSGSFVGGVTHDAGPYVQGDGTSGSLLLNANLPTMGVGHTNVSVGGLCYIAPSGNTRTLFSAFTSTSTAVDVLHDSSVFLTSRIGSFTGGAASITTINSAEHRGVILSSYDGSSRFLKIRRSSGITTGTGSPIAVGATPAVTPRFMADSRNTNFSNAGYGAFYISEGMTSSNADGFIIAIETLWETCTGMTIP
jgi:hypothetical protein